jgi:FAD/FMN-containing dehydrogenase
MDQSLIDRLKEIIGPAHVLTSAADKQAYEHEPRDLFIGHALCVVRPASTQDVAAIMQLCHSTRTALVPQGGNTGLVGGQIPDAHGDQIILSLKRMSAMREIDLLSNTLIVEAGMTLHDVQAIADSHDRLFPLSLASEGTCTIGGNLATNAGGTAVLAYGNTRDLVLGVEVVLSDGRVLSQLSKLKKDNTGYDLKHLFMGSEGTLGIITAASLKLFPKPRSIETAFIGLASPQAALSLLERAQSLLGESIKTFELIPRIGIDFVTTHMDARDPLNARHDWYVLLELASQAPNGLNEQLIDLLETALADEIIADASIATSLEQRRQFWNVREWLSDVQKCEGGSIKHDVSVPVHAVPAFLSDVYKRIDTLIPGARPVPFGHLGDGNIHCNISQPVGADKAAFLARWDEVNQAVHEIVLRYHGSISAEHGIGTLKRDLLPYVKDRVALDLMRQIKASLDPYNLLNPNKVLASK